MCGFVGFSNLKKDLTNDIYIRNLEPLSKLLAKLAESDKNLDI